MKKSLPTTTNTCRLGRRGVITPLHYLTRKEKKMASKKHYYKLADALGTFKYYLKHDDIDIEDEFDNLVSHVMTIFKDDNKDFKEDIFANEIKKIYNERFVEYNTELVEDDEDMEFQFRSPEHFKM